MFSLKRELVRCWLCKEAQRILGNIVFVVVGGSSSSSLTLQELREPYTVKAYKI